MTALQRVPAPDPLGTFDLDYHEAVIRLVWIVDRSTRDRTLLCAAVELLPHEVPAPILLPERCTTPSRRFFVYARDVVVPARRAMTWFDDAKRGVALRPEADGSFRDASDPSAPRFTLSALAEDPPDNSFVTSTTRVPFSADWHVSPRVRHLVSASSPLQDWRQEERDHATAWLKNEHHVDLQLFPEYTGSIHLIAPNPVFRSLFVRHERTNEKSALLIAFTPRARRSVEGLDLIIEEKRASGTGLLTRVRLEASRLRVELPHYPGEVRERVLDPERGLLFEGHFGVFLGGFTLKTRLASQVRSVDTGKPGGAYEVSLAGEMKNRDDVDSQPRVWSAAAVLHRGAVERERRGRGDTDQKWFLERGEDAVRALRDLVAVADAHLFVCDPYFGGDELAGVILAVRDPETEIRILTSAAHLRRAGGAAGELLEQRLEEARRAPPMNPVEVRVMAGKSPLIHDRFIVMKNATWMLGSSLNKFGERGTLMTRVLDPTPVHQDLERVWNESTALADWLARRRALVAP